MTYLYSDLSPIDNSKSQNARFYSSATMHAEITCPCTAWEVRHPLLLAITPRAPPTPPARIVRFHQDPSPKSPAFFHSGEVAYGFDGDFVGA